MKKILQTFFKYWIRPWAPFVLLFTPLAFADNEITIEQAGDNLDLQIDQFGADNVIKMQDANAAISDSLKVSQNEDGSFTLEWDKEDPQWKFLNGLTSQEIQTMIETVVKDGLDSDE